jgi:membrane associated rhomboid family serine protease
MFIPFHDNNPTQRWPVVTLSLIGMNLLWQNGQVLLIKVPQAEPEHIPEAPQQIQKLAPDSGEIYASLLTCMFLHGGWLHLIGNMWFLWLFGNNVEDRLGHIAFALFYTAGGLVATACHWITVPQDAIPVIGASGAVSGILGAYAITWPFAKVRTLVFLLIFLTIVELPALLVLGIWFVQQLLEATVLDLGVGGGVAWWAHIGGFIAGFVVMPIAGLLRPAPLEPWDAQFGPQVANRA